MLCKVLHTKASLYKDLQNLMSVVDIKQLIDTGKL